MLQHPDGKFRFAIAPNILNSDTAGYDFFDNEMNGSPSISGSRSPEPANKTELETVDKSGVSSAAPSGWLFYAHLFDSKYIDQHVYRLFFRNGSIPSYNSSSIQLVFSQSKDVLTEMEDYAAKRKFCTVRCSNTRL
jgi:hypothetical protein